VRVAIGASPDMNVPPVPYEPAFPGYQWTYRWRSGVLGWGQDLVMPRSATTVRTVDPRYNDLASRSAEQALDALLARARL